MCKNFQIVFFKYVQVGTSLGGPVVKNLPSNAEDMGLILVQGAKIPNAMGQLSPCTATREPACHN